ncbi:M3 family metallopeptidase [Paucibacter sp. APW11]|uniref:M3 family metallopeptidase n=1 Tax=Roseateles aquae TaxID=3077235 RepID=A0ABU3P6B3_9BURK|nr:M3 family metallopeptidase [Paucibacter sp. APW11]MDT8998120.1 M3 family metallopeptidase [Paucibacter sp. APW11]
MSFLSFSARRDLREQVWRAWVSRGEQPGATDNRAIVAELLALRQQQAELLGYACYADYALADTMAGSRAAVQALLDQVWEPAKDAAAREAAEIEAQMQGCGHALQAWDWRYYAEQVRQTRYAVNAAELKAYFPLDAMVEALFDCADRLFGLRFELLPEAPSYHPDVKVYQVSDADGSPRGLFLHDNFARTGKRSGAWMNALRWQSRGMEGPGSHSLPIILNTNNFAKPAVGQPALLSFDEARTLFHEFGHGLHGLLSEVEFERLSGTQVLRDFVELPSQIFEHWLSVPEVLKRHARHWQSGEPISDEMLARLKAAERFNQGYDTVRYCASALVDLAAHGVHPTSITDISAFELEAMKAAGLPEAIGLNHRLCHFQHLFSGSSYAAGYYVYLWAEVLDCDAYEAFAALGDPFDPALAEKLRSCILSVGNSREPGQAFRDFRGRDPRVEPMLRERGLLPEPI